MAKTHYANVDRANESDTQDYWSDTYCGLECCESPMSNIISEVDCKNCIKVFTAFERKLKHDNPMQEVEVVNKGKATIL